MRSWAFLLGLGPCLSPAQPWPRVTAGSAVVMDEETGVVLWQKAADSARPPASTTKVMTAMLFVEQIPGHEIVRAPRDVAAVEGSRLGLKPGEAMRASDLLAALMVRSANDAAHTIAVASAGSQRAFAKKMNERARMLGANRTRFVNPHGLPHPGHVSTARDLALIGRAALRYPALADVARTEAVRVSRSTRAQGSWLVRYNPFMDAVPEAVGLKTGWTRAAGHCFIGGTRRDGFGLVTVVMRSRDWVGDTRRLVEWAYANFERQRVAEKGVPIGRARVGEGSALGIELVATRDVYVPVRKGQAAPMWEPPTVRDAPSARGESVGVARMRFSDGTVVEVPVEAASGAPDPGESR